MTPRSRRPTRSTASVRSAWRRSANTRPPITAVEMAAPVHASVPVRTLAATTSPNPSTAQRAVRSVGKAMPPYSESPTAATTMMKPANSGVHKYSMMSHSAGSAMAAVRSLVRSRRTLHRAQPLALELGGGATEAALPLLEERQGLEVLPLAEVRPQCLGDVHLRVRQLPQKEVADAHLAACANQQVGVRDTLGAEVVRNGLLGDLPGRELAALDVAGDGTGGTGDVLAAAVAHGEDDRHAGVVAGRRDRRPQRLAHGGRQLPQATDREQADAVPHHLAELARQVLAQQRHQPVDLARRPVPVL